MKKILFTAFFLLICSLSFAEDTWWKCEELGFQHSLMLYEDSSFVWAISGQAVDGMATGKYSITNNKIQFTTTTQYGNINLILEVQENFEIISFTEYELSLKNTDDNLFLNTLYFTNGNNQKKIDVFGLYIGQDKNDVIDLLYSQGWRSFMSGYVFEDKEELKKASLRYNTFFNESGYGNFLDMAVNHIICTYAYDNNLNKTILESFEVFFSCSEVGIIEFLQTVTNMFSDLNLKKLKTELYYNSQYYFYIDQNNNLYITVIYSNNEQISFGFSVSNFNQELFDELGIEIN